MTLKLAILTILALIFGGKFLKALFEKALKGILVSLIVVIGFVLMAWFALSNPRCGQTLLDLWYQPGKTTSKIVEKNTGWPL